MVYKNNPKKISSAELNSHIVLNKPRNTTEIKGKDVYTLIADYGKPFQEEYDNKELLFNRLLELEQLNENEELPYIEIEVYKNEHERITDEIFKEYNFKKEKVGFIK